MSLTTAVLTGTVLTETVHARQLADGAVGVRRSSRSSSSPPSPSSPRRYRDVANRHRAKARGLRRAPRRRDASTAATEAGARAMTGDTAPATHRRDGRHVRPDPPRPPRRGERGRAVARARRGDLRPDRAAELQVGRHAPRAPLPHDGDRHGLQSAVHREPRRHRPADRPTFTIDTLRDIRAERPDADLFFITGADAIAQILAWKDVEELWELAHFVAVSRPGHVLSVSGLPEQDVSLLEVPALAISSTDCREQGAPGFPGVVLGARWGRPVHLQAPPLSECRMTSSQEPPLTRRELRERERCGSSRRLRRPRMPTPAPTPQPSRAAPAARLRRRLPRPRSPRPAAPPAPAPGVHPSAPRRGLRPVIAVRRSGRAAAARRAGEPLRVAAGPARGPARAGTARSGSSRRAVAAVSRPPRPSARSRVANCARCSTRTRPATSTTSTSMTSRPLRRAPAPARSAGGIPGSRMPAANPFAAPPVPTRAPAPHQVADAAIADEPVAAPKPVGHWTDQLNLPADRAEPFDQLLSRGGVSHGVPTTTNALILPTLPDTGPMGNPLAKSRRGHRHRLDRPAAELRCHRSPPEPDRLVRRRPPVRPGGGRRRRRRTGRRHARDQHAERVARDDGAAQEGGHERSARARRHRRRARARRRRHPRHRRASRGSSDHPRRSSPATGSERMTASDQALDSLALAARAGRLEGRRGSRRPRRVRTPPVRRRVPPRHGQLRAQRRRDRRRGRGGAPRGRREDPAPRGARCRPVGPARLRRPRRARVPPRGAPLLRPRAAVADCPALPVAPLLAAGS